MKQKKTPSTMQIAATVSAMGFEIFSFIIIGALGGSYLDGRFQTKHLWLPICAVAGFLFGIISCFYTLKSLIKEDDQ
ncbi:AtpZ/AtpI family protein [Sporolactobacillus sp. CPB3-1]|uniref:AtpZ/AtpI family protein n=1 Tax=Sporolactobacillus mangiferae TaxID=2940498 RepID=A0ABT0M8U2_9BACL|nr:AtpZ/AtpI family protein [Sporolactobacillus mangiferae]MCL1631274.1 AtpZ/AtpI family protein [Sporolactobacillus mangiferae]